MLFETMDKERLIAGIERIAETQEGILTALDELANCVRIIKRREAGREVLTPAFILSNGSVDGDGEQIDIIESATNHVCSKLVSKHGTIHPEIDMVVDTEKEPKNTLSEIAKAFIESDKEARENMLD